MAFVSSVIPAMLLPTDLVLDPNDPDFAQTGLRVRSVVRFHRLTTLATTMIRRDLGDFSPRQAQAAEERIHRLFEL